MKRSFRLQTALLSVVMIWGGDVHGEDAPLQREDIGRALEMYRWLIDHEEFSAAGKLAAELQAMHPDDPQVLLIVENAQLRAAVREANRVLVDDETSPIGFTVRDAEPETLQTSGLEPPSTAEPFSTAVEWRELSRVGESSATVPAPQPEAAANARNPRNGGELQQNLMDRAVDWDQVREFQALLEDDEWRAEQQRLSEEARVRMTLTEPVSLHFDDAPLRDVLRHVSEVCGLNVVVDEIALREQGVRPDVPVTINVDGIRVKSALHLVLRPLHLDYVVEDEVVKVTSSFRQSGELLTRVYAVADLVTPIPHRTPGSVPDRFAEVTAPPTGEFEHLIHQITTTVHPDSWSASGGQGHIVAHEDTLSLVIRQQEMIHGEIADLLSQLRELHDVQVSHAMHLLRVPVAGLHQLGLSETQTVRILTPLERTDYETTVFSKGSAFEIHSLPRLTLFNHQTGTVVDSERTVLVSSVASPDRRSVRLNVAAPETLDAGDIMAAVRSTDVPDGAVALVLIAEAPLLMSDVSRVDVLAVTPRIEVREEEEELIVLPMR